MKYYVGIDLGGTNIAIGILDEEKNFIEKISVPTLVRRGFSKIVEDMAKSTLALIEKSAIIMEQVESIGIGIPSSINPENNHVVYANNLEWINVDFISEFQKYIPDKKIFLANDADCAALGEAVAGSARNYDSALMITLGTGVGGGLIVDKKVYLGETKVGIEPGHTLLVYDGITCTCGKKGCLEAYASCTALKRQILEAIARDEMTMMRELCHSQIDAITPKLVFDAAKLGDKTAQDVIHQYIQYLAGGISSLINIFRPHVVIIGGGLSNQDEYLLVPLREGVKAFTYAGEVMDPPPVIKATLGNDAGIIGAAFLS